jgi:hypothetical protein
MDFHSAFVDLALRIYVLVIMAASELAIDHFHTADLDNAMILRGFKAGGFCIKNNLSHGLCLIM